MATKPGWRGRVFEDFEPGDVFEHPLGRTITQADNIWFTLNAINLGWDEVRLPAPVFEGDTLYAQSEVVEARRSRSRPAMGIVKLRTTGFNQDGVAVIEFLRTIMVYRRGHTPEGFRPRRPACP